MTKRERELIDALQKIADTPYSMVNDSEGLRHTLRAITTFAVQAIKYAKRDEV